MKDLTTIIKARDRIIDLLLTISVEYGGGCLSLQELIDNSEIKHDDLELLEDLNKIIEELKQ
ncbi:MAG: hypothetical protein LHW59_05350 [Candidatus Cloacimonetes bacterium]|nr:hypothetical protein [Candidatus Cloacimonadota bacterium]